MEPIVNPTANVVGIIVGIGLIAWPLLRRLTLTRRTP